MFLVKKYFKVEYGKSEYQHQTSDNVWQKIELCPTKAASQQTQLPDFFISYQRLETQKYSVSIGLSGSGFSFYEHFHLLMQFFVYFRPLDVFE